MFNFKFATAAIFFCLPICSGFSATYLTGFESPTYVHSTDLAGQDGWTINHRDPSELEASFFASVTGSKWGLLGGIDLVPTAPTNINLSHAHSGLFAGTNFSAKFLIVHDDVPTDKRDSFNWFFSDGGGELLTIAFEPNPAQPDRWEIAWYERSNPGVRNLLTPVSQDIFTYAIYGLSVSFAQAGPDATFNATLTPGVGAPRSWSGTLPGAGASEFSAFGVGWDLVSPPNASRNNFIAFDNISIVSPIPEPSASTLQLLALAVVIGRRKRRSA